MAKEKTYSEVLNLRIDPAMAAEVKRIAAQRDKPDSEAARLLLAWGIAAHRDMEAKTLQRPYDAAAPDLPMEMRIGVWWVQWDPEGEPLAGSVVPSD
jgi:hypothetical protein